METADPPVAAEKPAVAAAAVLKKGRMTRQDKLKAMAEAKPKSGKAAAPEPHARVKDLVRPHVESFNFFLGPGKELLCKHVEPVEIRNPDTRELIEVSIKDVHIGMPCMNNPEQYMYPCEARQAQLTYCAPATVKVSIVNVTSGTSSLLSCNVGRIPMMVGTKNCWVGQSTYDQLPLLCEDTNEVGGYFIINGNEKLVRMLIYPRPNHPLAFGRQSWCHKGPHYTKYGCSIRCVRDDSTAQSLTLHYLNNGEVTLRIIYRKQEFFIPAILLLKAMSGVSDQVIYERLTRNDSSNPSLTSAAEMVLTASKNAQGMPAIRTQDDALAFIGGRFRIVLPPSERKTDAQVGRSFIDRFLFVHLTNWADKCNLMFFMMRKLFSLVAGEIDEENVDSPAHQAALLPGHLYLAIFKDLLTEWLQIARGTILKDMSLEKKIDLRNTEYLRSKLEGTASVGRRLEAFLATGTYNSKTGIDLMQVAGFSIMADRLNFNRFMAHFQSIHRGAFYATMKTTDIRKLQPEAWGFLCFPSECTRVLTNKGFLFLDEIEAYKAKGEEVLYAAYAPNTKKITFVSGTLVYPDPVAKEQKFIEFTALETTHTNQLSLLVTPEHEMYVQRTATSTPSKVPASELLTTDPAKCITFTAAAENGFDGDETAVLAQLRNSGVRLDTKEQFDSFIELYFFWLGVGFPNHKEQDKLWLKSQFQKLGLRAEEDWTESENLLCIKRADLVAFFTAHATHEKRMMAWVWSLSKSQIIAGIDALRRATGSMATDEICTSSCHFRDELLALMIRAGYTAHFVATSADAWKIVYSATTQATHPNLTCSTEVTEVTRMSRTWCVTINHPDHLIFAQRAERDTQNNVTKASRPIIVGQCPVHTPDGGPCGLLNHLAIGNRPLGFPALKQQDENVLSTLTELGVTLLSQSGGILPPNYIEVLLNGRVVGHVHFDKAATTCDALRAIKVKQSRALPEHLEIAFVDGRYGTGFKAVYLSSDLGRMVRPVLHRALNRVEWIGVLEQVFMEIALPDTTDPAMMHSSHRELTAANMLSVLGNMSPFSDMNPSARCIYQCQMAKQTMGTPCHSWNYRSDNKLLRVHYLQKPICHTKHQKPFATDMYPSGTNAVVAVIAYTGYDMEDALILNKSSVERGFGHGSMFKSYVVNLERDSHSAQNKERLCGIDPHSKKIAAPTLGIDGLPFPGEILNEGDAIYGVLAETTGSYHLKRLAVSGESVYVDTVRLLPSLGSNFRDLGDTGGTARKANVKLRYNRNPVVGDKFSSRHGQKGVTSRLWPMRDMPFSESGMCPDVIINPHAFPSRMTIGMLVESMAGKSGSLHGLWQDCSSFRFDEKNTAVDFFAEQLQKAGYAYYGTEPMYSGVTGELFEAHVYLGVVYYQRLVHQVKDKFQARSTGPVNELTQQPVHGRKRGGGIRLGEMERDSLVAHGTTMLVQDRLFNCSDKSLHYVCRHCGSIVSALPVISSDNTTINTVCKQCSTAGMEAIYLPFVLRYLSSELAAMNIRLTVLTK